jgi:hypothetical protein
MVSGVRLQNLELLMPRLKIPNEQSLKLGVKTLWN